MMMQDHKPSNIPPVGSFVWSCQTQFNVYNLQGLRENLLETATENLLVVTFSSMTCPFCVAESDNLDKIYCKYHDKGVFLTAVYTQEAHPGEYVGFTTSLEEKIQRALQFKSDLSVQRPVYVDGMDDTLHKINDLRPNSCIIITTDGQLAFRSWWTQAAEIQQRLDHLLWVQDKRRNGQDMRGFVQEELIFTPFDTTFYLEGLQRNGTQAVFDVGVALIREARASILDMPNKPRRTRE